jgi:hypothetical protein
MIAAGAGTLNIPTATNAQPTTDTYSGLVETEKVCLMPPYPIDSVFSQSRYTALKTSPTAAALTPPNMICDRKTATECVQSKCIGRLQDGNSRNSQQALL